MLNSVQTTLNSLQTIFSNLTLFGGERKINVYIDGRSYYSVNLTTGEVGYTYHQILETGDMDERITFDDCKFEDLCLMTQIELLLAVDESIGK